MADEKTTPTLKAKSYKLAKGTSIFLPKLQRKFTAQELLNAANVNLIRKYHPELFAQGVIVLA